MHRQSGTPGQLSRPLQSLNLLGTVVTVGRYSRCAIDKANPESCSPRGVLNEHREQANGKKPPREAIMKKPS